LARAELSAVNVAQPPSAVEVCTKFTMKHMKSVKIKSQ